MNWTIEFHRKAFEEFYELPDSFRDDFDALFVNIRRNGFLNLPRGSVKNIGDGIRELRVMGKNGIARSLYVTEAEKTVRILVAFVKKTQETPRRIIEIAHRRRSERQ